MVCGQCNQQMYTATQFCSHCGKPLPAGRPYGFSGLVRPRAGRRIAGVCAGIAEMYCLDVTLVRLVTFLLFIAGFGSIFLIYLGAWIVLPNESGVYPPVNYTGYPPAPTPQNYPTSAPAA